MEELTYSQLIHNAKSLAAGLQTSQGLKYGQCVALALPNCTEFIVTLLAVNHLGAVASFVNPVYTPRQCFFFNLFLFHNKSILFTFLLKVNWNMLLV